MRERDQDPQDCVDNDPVGPKIKIFFKFASYSQIVESWVQELEWDLPEFNEAEQEPYYLHKIGFCVSAFPSKHD